MLQNSQRVNLPISFIQLKSLIKNKWVLKPLKLITISQNSILALIKFQAVFNQLPQMEQKPELNKKVQVNNKQFNHQLLR